MTLCMAWRDGNKVLMASDSRLTIPGSQPFDNCVKVTSIPVEVTGPINNKGKSSNKRYSHRIGMCYAGNLHSAYNVKEIVCQALSSLQAMPDISGYTMDNVCSLVTHLYREIVKNACNSLYKKGMSGLIITGYCPQKREVRTFLIDTDDTTCPITSKSKEILLQSGEIEFIGSGAAEAKGKFRDIAVTHPLKILKSVINGSDKTVGGAVQVGIITDYDFRVYGVQDYEVDHSERELRTFFSLNGINLLESPFTNQNTGLHMQQTVIKPFEKAINSLIGQGYNIKEQFD